MKEQGEASNLLASNIEHIAQVTEENSAVAKNTAELASVLDNLSREMQNIVKHYHI